MQSALVAQLRAAPHAEAEHSFDTQRLAVYRRLIVNNLQQLLRQAFPVLHSLYAAPDWLRLIEEFWLHHRCESPFFPDLSAEFLSFLLQEYTVQPEDPPFLTELAHYEWVELALANSDAELLVEPDAERPLLEQALALSPLAWCLCYRYPVYRLSPAYRPSAPPAAPTWLVVYRDVRDAVHFLAVTEATAALLQALKDPCAVSAAERLRCVVSVLPADQQAQRWEQIAGQLEELVRKRVVGVAPVAANLD